MTIPHPTRAAVLDIAGNQQALLKSQREMHEVDQPAEIEKP